MRTCLLCMGLLLLAGCGQDTKSPANPVQPEGPAAADSARVAVFADTSLEAAVRTALQQPDGRLTNEDLLSLTQLAARGRGIASLAGIESLENLTVLDLADNQIQDTSPLAALTQLTYLDLGNNKIKDIGPMAALVELQVLVLDFNAVSDLTPLVDLPVLINLEVRGNPLDEASLSRHLPALRSRGVEVGSLAEESEEVVEVSEPLPDLPGRITFSGRPEYQQGNYDIFAVSLKSTRLVQVTSDLEDEHEPVWSPDGQRIAFVRGAEQEQGDICVVQVGEDGGHSLANLTRGEGDNRSPSWSPDGRRIVFAHSTATTLKQIYVMDIDGENLAQLTRIEGACQYPCWSPDGRRIAFVAKPRGVAQRQVCIMDADGSQVTQLPDNGVAYISNLDWSPDGKRIAYGGAYGGEIFSLCSIAADGTDSARHGPGMSPAWVDDTRLLYSLYGSSNYGALSDIYLLVLGSKDRVNLTEILRRHGGVNTLVNGEPAWTPTDW